MVTFSFFISKDLSAGLEELGPVCLSVRSLLTAVLEVAPCTSSASFPASLPQEQGRGLAHCYVTVPCGSEELCMAESGK